MMIHELYLENHPLPTDAMKKAKETKSMLSFATDAIAVSIWYYQNERPYFISLTPDKKEGYKYGFFISSNSKEIKALNKAIKKLNSANYSDLIDYLCDKYDSYPVLKELDKRSGIYLLDYNDDIYVWITEEDKFKDFLSATSEIIRGLIESPYIKFDKLASSAIDNTAKLPEYLNILENNYKLAVKYPGQISFLTNFMQEHDLSEELLPALALAACASEAGSFSQLCHKFDIAKKLVSLDLAENLFILIQQIMKELYIDSFKGYASKDFLLSIVKTLGTAFDALGFGIYSNGLETIVRLFENDIIEGIDLNSYQSNDKYDSEDYGYYDSQENETHYNKVWQEMDIASLFKSR